MDQGNECSSGGTGGPESELVIAIELRWWVQK